MVFSVSLMEPVCPHPTPPPPQTKKKEILYALKSMHVAFALKEKKIVQVVEATRTLKCAQSHLRYLFEMNGLKA